MQDASVGCSVCGTRFVPRFVYQSEATSRGLRFYCSVGCRVPELESGGDPEWAMRRCAVCDRAFSVAYAYQVVSLGSTTRVVCSEACRAILLSPSVFQSPLGTSRSPETGALCDAPRSEEAPGSEDGRCSEEMTSEHSTSETIRAGAEVEPKEHAASATRWLAVWNPKGGTGKTTSSISIAAGLARRGHRTLLVDLDAQGSIAAYFDLRRPRTLFHMLFEGRTLDDVAFPLRRDLYLIVTDPFAPSVELEVRDRAVAFELLVRRLPDVVACGAFDCVVLDCPPSDGSVNDSALELASDVVIPVSCDYLALAAVKRALRTVRQVAEHREIDLNIMLLPTFHEPRSRTSAVALEALVAYAPGRVLPAVRVSRQLREAPNHKKSIFEHAPASSGAKDFSAVVSAMLERWSVSASSAELKSTPGSESSPGLMGTSGSESSSAMECTSGSESSSASEFRSGRRALLRQGRLEPTPSLPGARDSHFTSEDRGRNNGGAHDRGGIDG